MWAGKEVGRWGGGARGRDGEAVIGNLAHLIKHPHASSELRLHRHSSHLRVHRHSSHRGTHCLRHDTSVEGALENVFFELASLILKKREGREVAPSF